MSDNGYKMVGSVGGIYISLGEFEEQLRKKIAQGQNRKLTTEDYEEIRLGYLKDIYYNNKNN